MSIINKLSDSKKEIDNIGQTLFQIEDIADDLKRHFENDYKVYKSREEAIKDVEILKTKIRNIRGLIYE